MTSARQRVEAALRGGHSECVPFSIYESMIPQCVDERKMRNRGLCIVDRSVPVVRTHRPNVKARQEVYWEGSRQFTRTWYETPVGTLTSLSEAGGFTSWLHEKPFKSPDDYRALRFFIEDEQYEPCYDIFQRRQEELGNDFILRPNLGLEPMQLLITGGLIDMEEYCVQWFENRDEILKLYEAVVAQRRKLYPLVAASPAGHTNYGGNVVPDIVGLENFKKYWVPHYNEAAEVFHRHGKLLGCHFDDDCKLLSGAIAECDLDYVEAFTPAPDSDMTLAQAREVWPNKVLWLNFPSSQHLCSDEQVRKIAFDLVDSLASVDGLLVGVTENMPPERWRNSCTSIMDGLEDHAKAHPEQYR